ncbi:KDM4A demethylase, partial [Amia calva]|nr:KDM4A demethylase [Amia calva]
MASDSGPQNPSNRIMTFYPTKEEFKNFSRYIAYIESQGAHRAGLAKVVPPKDWKPRKCYDDIDGLVIPAPIQQVVTGQSGLFTQYNIQKKPMTVREFRKIANSDKFCNPRYADFEELERKYWKNLTFNPPIYGADVNGTLYDKDITEWNIGHLNTILDTVERESGITIEGVNTPYLYFGMWKTTFAWHTEDMDLYSINYLHFGEPKSWYCIPPEHGKRLERLAKGFFPGSSQNCEAFLRHKMTLISPSILKKYGIPFEKITQEAGEFMVTFPYGYHAGFNHGFNCAESTNFATRRWIEYGKQAILCSCRKDMVKISMDVFVRKFQPDRYKQWKAGKDNMVIDHSRPTPEAAEFLKDGKGGFETYSDTDCNEDVHSEEEEEEVEEEKKKKSLSKQRIGTKRHRVCLEVPEEVLTKEELVDTRYEEEVSDKKVKLANPLDQQLAAECSEKPSLHDRGPSTESADPAETEHTDSTPHLLRGTWEAPEEERVVGGPPSPVVAGPSGDPLSCAAPQSVPSSDPGSLALQRTLSPAEALQVHSYAKEDHSAADVVLAGEKKARCTGSPAPPGWHIHTCCRKKVCCVSQYSLEHGGGTKRRAVTRGELDRGVEGHQPSSRTGICSFVRGGTGGVLPEPYKMTSSGLLVCMFLTKLSQTDSMRASSATCAHSPAPCSLIGIRQRTPELAEETEIKHLKSKRQPLSKLPRHHPLIKDCFSDEELQDQGTADEDAVDSELWSKPLAQLWHNKPHNLQAEREYNQTMGQQAPYCAVCMLFQTYQQSEYSSSNQSPEKESTGEQLRTKPLIPEMCFTTTEDNSEVHFSAPYLEEDGTSLLISCSQCCVRVHTSCYGVAPEKVSDHWKCARCEANAMTENCCLCSLRGGALQRANNDKWVHVLCAVAVLEARFVNIAERSPVDLSGIPLQRFKLKCFYCKKRMKRAAGCCVQCSHGRCPTSFHATCAQAAGVLMQPDDWPFVVFITCYRHKGPIHTERNKASMRELSVGQKVICKHKNGRYYQSEVVRLTKETFYEVNFDDGSFSDNLFPEDIVSRDCVQLGPPGDGEVVQVRWTDGLVYGAKFVAAHIIQMYQVEFEDGSQLPAKRDDVYTLDEELPKRVKSRLSVASDMRFDGIFTEKEVKQESKRQRVINSRYRGDYIEPVVYRAIME